MARTVILYHGDCPDGFGGAFAAWKKFGNAAEYVPIKHGRPVPKGLAGAELYFIDFVYKKPEMNQIAAEAASLVVLDHHEGVRDVVESMPHHIYDANRSGATIAWSYFHPETPVPTLLSYVEDGDLYRFALPDAHALLSYIYTEPFTFESWDTIASDLEKPEKRTEMIARGEVYRRHSDLIINELVNDAKLVKFEGHICYFSPTLSIFASDLGNRLARKRGPLALAVQARPDGLRISLRGDGSVDVAKIAQKYGGNGHPNASAFSLPWGTPIPWEEVYEDPLN
ncbi:MAG: hypothetical protein AAB440_02410 [Patescibacteria group bacterium]